MNPYFLPLQTQVVVGPFMRKLKPKAGAEQKLPGDVSGLRGPLGGLRPGRKLGGAVAVWLRGGSCRKTVGKRVIGELTSVWPHSMHMPSHPRLLNDMDGCKLQLHGSR